MSTAESLQQLLHQPCRVLACRSCGPVQYRHRKRIAELIRQFVMDRYASDVSANLSLAVSLKLKLSELIPNQCSNLLIVVLLRCQAVEQQLADLESADEGDVEMVHQAEQRRKQRAEKQAAVAAKGKKA